MKEDCIFCKLANGVIPTHSLYEDDDFKVIFDAAPATDGHALILPKKHYENIYELDEDVASKVFVLAKKVSMGMKEAFDTDGFNVVQNNGEIAGQTVFHFHMHLIPRYKGDAGIKLWKPGKVSDEKIAELESKIKEVL